MGGVIIICQLIVYSLCSVLPSSGGSDTTTPTAIQSTTPGTQIIGAITVRTVCHHFTLSARE